VQSEKLWQAFTASDHPKNDLILLGKSLFFGKPFPKLDNRAKKIVSDVAASSGAQAEPLYEAMNQVPLGGMSAARKLLGDFGQDVLHKKSWAEAKVTTQDLMVKTVAALASPKATPAAGSQPKAKAVAATAVSHAASQTHARATEHPGDAPAFHLAEQGAPIDLYRLPFGKLYREAVMMQGDDSELVSEAKRAEAKIRKLSDTTTKLASATADLSSENASLRAQNDRQAQIVIADAALAVKQGKATRAQVEQARDLATARSMTKTAIELDRIARSMPADKARPEPKKGMPTAGKIVLGAAAVAAAVGIAHIHGQHTTDKKKT
jgi:hypothetical protein